MNILRALYESFGNFISVTTRLDHHDSIDKIRNEFENVRIYFANIIKAPKRSIIYYIYKFQYSVIF